MSTLKAVFLDLDGTILDTEGQYAIFWRDLIEKYFPGRSDIAKKIQGTSLLKTLELFPDQEAKDAVTRAMTEFEADSLPYKFFPHSLDFIADLRKNGIRCAVVTSSNEIKMSSVKRQIPEFDSYFDRVITANEFKRSKPAPDCYLLGAEIFGCTPDECIVFEDAFNGLESGMDAGMFTVGKTGSNSRKAIEGKCSYVIDSYEGLSARRLCNVSGKILPGLAEYVNNEIIPRYDTFDKAHRRDHAEAVINRSMDLAAHYPVDINIVYAAAAFHDTGLVADRKVHHLESGVIIRADKMLRTWFSEDEIETIAQAAEDHRASSDHEPRSIYGKIVSEADRLIDGNTIIRRTVLYGLAHYPELDREAQIRRTLEHLDEKYAEGGYLKLWIPESPNAARLKELQETIRDREKITALVSRILDEESEQE